MTELKSSWKVVMFGDIVQNIAVRVNPADAKTNVYVGLEHLDPSTIHLRQWGHPSDVSGQKLAFMKGDVIFGRRRAYQRKLAVAEFDGICSAHALVLRAKPKMILPDFLPFFLQSDMFMERAIEISVGSLSPTINWKTLRVQYFALPPLDEQQRFAELLWAADEAAESKSKLVTALKIAKSVTIKEFCQKGVSNSSFQSSVLGEIPSNWSVMKLGEISEFLDGKRIPVKKADRAIRQGEFPYYGASGIIDWIDDYIFNDELILIGEDGANIVERSTPLAFKVSGKSWVNNHAHVLKPFGFMDTDYLVEYLESISYAPFTSGTAQPKINKSACESIPIPVPPLNEQNKMSSIFVSYDKQIGSTEKTISDTKVLLRSVMSEALERTAYV